jgi:imidazolonepropionase-like amidohydrolase
MKTLYTFIIISFGIILNAQMVTKSKLGSVLFKNGTIHTITKGVINADLFIENGKIANIGSGLNPTGSYVTIDCTSKHIYPGMIDGGTQLGLSEIEAVSITNDFNEIGDFIPHMQALTAVNPNAVAIPVTRTNGVTTVLASPGGGRFPGTAALIDLQGYTPEQMYAGFKGVAMNFPSSGRRGRFDKRTDEDITKDSDKAMKKLAETWDAITLYAKIDSSANAEGKKLDSYQPEMHAMLDVIRGKQTMLIEVNKEEDIKAAIKWLEGKKVNAVFTGVSEGYRVAKEIAKSKIPVITGPITDLPRREYDKYDAPYANAGLMLKAGVKVAIRTDESENVRNLPFHAGFAAAYGMGVDEAYKAVSIVPAEIFGVADKYGSIENGKVANLFICDGDPFETKTQISHVFIRGWQIPIESRQTLLYDEFLKRSPGN